MKTAEIVLQEYHKNMAYSKETVIAAMKEYAQIVAEQALKDAAEKATVTFIYDKWEPDRQTILETPIHLP